MSKTGTGKNFVSVYGKLISAQIEDKQTKDNRPMKIAKLVIRATNTYNGRTEVNEVPVEMMGVKFTSTGKLNPAYSNIEKLESFKTADSVGYDNADFVCIKRGEFQENNFFSTRTNKVVSSWRIRSSFIDKGSGEESASFEEEIFILNMIEEVDRDGDFTGRLIVRGGIVGYGDVLHVFDFIVEGPDNVQGAQNMWNVGDTVLIKGRVRYTSMDVEVQDTSADTTSGWGEDDLPVHSVPKTIRELVITRGWDPYEEDLAYDGEYIQKLFNERKAKIESLVAPAEKVEEAVPAKKKYAWGE